MEFNNIIELVNNGQFKNLSRAEIWKIEVALEKEGGFQAVEALKNVKAYLREDSVQPNFENKVYDLAEFYFAKDESAFRPEVAERYEAALRLAKTTPVKKGEFYHVNDLLDDASEKIAIMNLAISKKPITKEVLTEVRATERKKIAIDYYAAVLNTKLKDAFKNENLAIKNFFNIKEMVEKGKSAKDIYAKLNVLPSKEEILGVSYGVAMASKNKLKTWISKAGEHGVRFGKAANEALAWCDEMERSNPLTAKAVAIGGSMVCAPFAAVYGGYRVSMALHKLYEANKTFEEKEGFVKEKGLKGILNKFKDKKFRDASVNALAASLRGNTIAMIANTAYTVMKKDFRDGMKANFKMGAEAMKDFMNGVDKVSAKKKLMTAAGVFAVASLAVLASSCSDASVEETSELIPETGGDLGKDFKFYEHQGDNTAAPTQTQTLETESTGVNAPTQTLETESVGDSVPQEIVAPKEFSSEEAMGLKEHRFNDMVDHFGEKYEIYYERLSDDFMENFEGQTREQVLYKIAKLEEWTNVGRYQYQDVFVSLRTVLECGETVEVVKIEEIKAALDNIGEKGEWLPGGETMDVRTIGRVSGDCEENATLVIEKILKNKQETLSQTLDVERVVVMDKLEASEPQLLDVEVPGAPTIGEVEFPEIKDETLRPEGYASNTAEHYRQLLEKHGLSLPKNEGVTLEKVETLYNQVSENAGGYSNDGIYNVGGGGAETGSGTVLTLDGHADIGEEHENHAKSKNLDVDKVKTSANTQTNAKLINNLYKNQGGQSYF